MPLEPFAIREGPFDHGQAERSDGDDGEHERPHDDVESNPAADAAIGEYPRRMVPLLWLAACSRPDSAAKVDRPNLVFVVTDDQRADSMFAMPLTDAALGDAGVRFDAAYVGTPMCCPVRASYLSGGFSPANTGVLTNESPNGGYSAFETESSLPKRLQGVGYTTALYGKYLNEYETSDPAIPEGWDDWAALTGDLVYTGWTAVVPDGSGNPTTTSTDDYLTDWLGGKATTFIADHADSGPFFLMVPVLAPHAPPEPAPEDAGMYADFTPDSPAIGEDVSDKPEWVQEETYDADYNLQQIREGLETLPAVDRLVSGVVDALDSAGVLDHTVLIFTSDNGMQYGEHNLSGKGAPYEESIHVPLYIRTPDAEVRATSALVAANLDVGATLQDAAGLTVNGDGESLLPLVRGETDAGRDGIHLDYYTDGHPVWAGWETDRWTWVEYGTGETELYDRSTDPYQLTNVASSPPSDAPVDELRSLTESGWSLTITTQELPAAIVGEPYSATLSAWSAAPPVTWKTTIDPPAGLTLSSDGVLSGTPTEAGSFVVHVLAKDNSTRSYTGEGTAFRQQIALDVGTAVAAGPPGVTTSGRSATVTIVADRPLRLQLDASPDSAFDLDARHVLPQVRQDGDQWVNTWTFPVFGPARWYWKLPGHRSGSFDVGNKP